ncbi:MAG: nucleotide exchange factor GrpE [Marinobacter sp.]|uniref:nucleotide exchange factor GrpE n=1 Tax=Marinobacter sp. TaxID=50741 RepID=UPI0034A00308
MSADENRHDDPEKELRDAINEQPVDQPEQSPKQQPGQQEEPTELTKDEVEALRGQVQEYQEQMLRTHAEMQNVRRRAEIDVEKAHKFAVEKFVKELLPVADSLEKAVENTEGKEVDSELVATIREGAEMTLNLFMNSLRKFNVAQIDPVGEPFDPQLHEAMSMVPSPNAEPNSVVAVVQKGYTLNERLVRPAMVVVAKAQDAPKIDEQA